MRELEKKAYKLFFFAGGSFAIGLVLYITALLAFIGIPLMLFGLGLFFVSMLWLIRLSKKPAWDLFCPYCSSRNEVFKSHDRFDCDICERPVLVNEYGEPVPVEPVINRRIS